VNVKSGWFVLVMLGCGTDDPPADEAVRERDVIVTVPERAGRVIFQDGNGAWQLAPPLDDVRYGFDLEGERYAVAVLCVTADLQQLEAVYATTRERPDVVLHASCEPRRIATPHRITGTLDSLEESGHVVAGRAGGVRGSSPSYVLPASDGPQNLVFGRAVSGNAVDTLVVRRDVAVAGDRVENVDFFAEGVPAVWTTVFVDDFFPNVVVQSEFAFGGTTVELASTVGSPGQIVSPAPEHWRGGDVLRLTVVASGSGSDGELFCNTTTNVASPEQIPLGFSFTFPIKAAAVSALEGGYEAAWSQHEVATVYTGYQVGLFDDDGNPNDQCTDELCFPSWTAEVTIGWLEDLSRYSIRLPKPAELELLGVWDTRLAHDIGARWTIAARLDFDRGNLTTGRSGPLLQAVR
jgi:hypothetical protein